MSYNAKNVMNTEWGEGGGWRERRGGGAEGDCMNAVCRIQMLFCHISVLSGWRK